MKKKIISLLIIIFIPFNVYACPHVDSEGNAHLQTYNEDYTKMDMIYPKEGYLYVRNVDMSIESSMVKAHEDTLHNEIYSFPVLLNATDYMTYYWFLDDSLVQNGVENLDVETTIKNTDSMHMCSDKYDLNIHLSNSYTKGLTYEGDYITQIYYDVIVVDQSDNEKYIDKISDANLTKISDTIIDLSARYQVTKVEDYRYETTYKAVKEFDDLVEVTIKSNENLDNIVAVNLDKTINADNFLEVTKTDLGYTFNAENEGNYALVEKTDAFTEVVVEEDVEEKEITADIEIEEKNEEINLIIPIVIGSIILISIIITVIVLKKRK